LSVEDVFQRSYKKFNERLDAVNIQEAEKAWYSAWDQVKNRQKEENKNEHEGLYGSGK
jgi:hypothetical protein